MKEKMFFCLLILWIFIVANFNITFANDIDMSYLKEYKNVCINNDGNILKTGDVCINGADTYYINYEDNGSLYKTNGKENMKLYNNYVRNLYTYDKYLYFVESNLDTAEIKKMDLNNFNIQTLVTTDGINGIMDMYVVNTDVLYYKSNNKIYKFDNGQSDIIYENGNQIFNFIIKDDNIYFNDFNPKDSTNNLKRYNITSKSEDVIANNIIDFAVSNTDYYYIDDNYYLYSNNEKINDVTTDYILSEEDKLFYMDKNSNNIYSITDGKISLYAKNNPKKTFNVINSNIYFGEIIEESIAFLEENDISSENDSENDDQISAFSITGEYKNWKQTDPRWANKRLANGGSMASIGCTVTSISINIVHKGMRDESQFNPGMLCDFLNNNGGFTTGGAIYWGAVSKMINGFTLSNSNINLSGNNANKAAQIASYMNKGYAVLIQVNSGGHWVACDRVSGSTVYIMDPGYRGRTDLFSSYSSSGIYRIVTYSADSSKSLVQLDNEAPKITNYGIKNITNSGYTVYCNVTDNVGVNDVKFPTWYTDKRDETIKWLGCTSKNGNYYECSINLNEFGNRQGNYATHIYAYDSVRSTGVPLNPIFIDKTAPSVNNIVVTKTNTGYTITCTATDNDAVNRVQFPTWTSANGQDDIIYGWENSSKASGTKNGNQYTYTVKYNEHNNEQGDYNTHIYAYDNFGNYVCKAIDIVNNSQYTIKYDANGGSGSPANTVKVRDVPVNISNSKPTRAGYSFVGWGTTNNSVTAKYFPGELYTGNENLTLYAVWKETSTSTAYIKGDVNGDGSIDTTDLTMVTKYIIQSISLNSYQFFAADVTRDGDVNISDLSRLKRYLIGEISNF